MSAHIGGGMALQSDGKILMNGGFTFAGANETRLAVFRFNTDGSIDPSYISTNVIACNPNAFVLQPDGKLIVGGRRATVAGLDQDGMVRLNPEGSLDAAFDPKIGPQGDVVAVAVQSAGSILLGGSFRTVNGVSRSRIAQLNGDGSLAGNFSFETPILTPQGEFRLIMQGSAGTPQILEASTNLIDWSPIHTNGTSGKPLDFVDPDYSRFYQRFYRAVMKP